MSASVFNLRDYHIPLQEILVATQDFNPEILIRHVRFGSVYKGELSEHRTVDIKRFHGHSYEAEQEFYNELHTVSRFHHPNIISFIGYCNEGTEAIIVYEHAIYGSLDHFLHDQDRKHFISWEQRLKICIEAARGLEYLDSGLGEDRALIHTNINSQTIYLGKNLEAKICEFGLGLSLRTQLYSEKPTYYADTNFHIDPNYYQSGILTEASDVYAFGVVLFEMLSGMLAYHRRSIEDHKPQTLINLVRRYYDDGLEKLIDPSIRTQIDGDSFNMYKEVANKCISFRSEDRPKMDSIISRIEKALELQNNGAASTINTQSHRYQEFRIPLKEMNLATQDFSPETWIRNDRFGKVYKGKLSQCWQKSTAAFKLMDPYGYRGEPDFLTEVEMMSNFNHQNIVPFIGYCDEDNAMIVVTEYATNGSLDQHLEKPEKISCINWAQRLEICIGAARGLEYLHSGLRKHNRVVIHRDVNSANILLDGDLKAKHCGFVLSISFDRNQPQVYEPAAGNLFYLDPIYNETGIVNLKSDIYSFGVVMFELLSGMLAYTRRSIGDDQPRTLLDLVQRYYNAEMEVLIDPFIRDDIKIPSFDKFKEIAYQCISLNTTERPSVGRIIEKIGEALDIQLQNDEATSTITKQSHQYENLESYRIPLEQINSATRNFSSETAIGDGGFGMVYKGQIYRGGVQITVAVKRHALTSLQGKHEFLNELKLSSTFHHENIIRFVGYCDEGCEKLLVYEYASNGSLDHHLWDKIKRGNLTWAQRLKICLGAARGLNYLHSGLGNNNRVIHRDVNSGNILLDENLDAKICDFGLSRESPRNQPRTYMYTNAAGTNFYLDPIYQESGILRKESDVYSFGVVLFEMLSGMLAYHPKRSEDGNPQYLINLVRRHYNNGLKQLTDPFIRNQIDTQCFNIFTELAYQCISYSSQERPTMHTIIESIQHAIDFQVNHFL